MDKPYLSPEEATKQLGICPREIRKMMRNNEIDLGLAVKKTTRSGKSAGSSIFTSRKLTR